MSTSNYGIWCTEPGATGMNVVSQTPLRFVLARKDNSGNFCRDENGHLVPKVDAKGRELVQTLYLTHINGVKKDHRNEFREKAGNAAAILNDAEIHLNVITDDGWYTEDMGSAPPVFTRAESGHYALSRLVRETYNGHILPLIPYKS